MKWWANTTRLTHIPASVANVATNKANKCANGCGGNKAMCVCVCAVHMNNDKWVSAWNLLLLLWAFCWAIKLNLTLPVVQTVSKRYPAQQQQLLEQMAWAGACSWAWH